MIEATRPPGGRGRKARVTAKGPQLSKEEDSKAKRPKGLNEKKHSNLLYRENYKSIIPNVFRDGLRDGSVGREGAAGLGGTTYKKKWIRNQVGGKKMALT